MPYFLKINQNYFVSPVYFPLDSDRRCRPLIPIAIQKVTEFDRNRWPICTGLRTQGGILGKTPQNRYIYCTPKSVSKMDNNFSNKVTEAAYMLKAADILYDVSQGLPWRVNRTPYRVFLAEFLLVRTRTDVITRVFEEIVAAYPNINTLAKASEEELASVLKPLGLRKRVPILIRAANYIVRDHNGQIPTNINDLFNIPGLGLYTSVAIAAFAFDSIEVPADVNILRFLSRFSGLEMSHPTKGSEKLRELLPFLSKANSGLPAEKLLDFSRLVCCPKRPRCLDCPLRSQCHYFVDRGSH